MPPRAKKVRKQYTNSDHPHVVLRFEDGHEIDIPKGTAKSFDAFTSTSLIGDTFRRCEAMWNVIVRSD